MAYNDEKPRRKTAEEVVKRVEYLRELNRPFLDDRGRIRAVMNGGQGAIDVLLQGLDKNEHSLPAANMIKSGIERFSEMIAPPPDLRVEPPQHTDATKPKEEAQKRERIVRNFDRLCRLERQLQQASLWLPGYGYFTWRLCEARDRNGYRYPKAELRDPFTTWLAEWGVDHEPRDVVYQRFYASDEDIRRAYPRAQRRYVRGAGGALDLASANYGTVGGWDGSRGGVEVLEYIDGWGVYLYSPAFEGLLDAYPHPLNRPPFVAPRRVTFDELKGQFTDMIGLASVGAKLTLLSQIVMEDAAFAPIVVTGRMDGAFVKGRDAVNMMEGGDAKYVYQNIPYQMFQEIDRIDRHFRTSSGYSQQADGESPIAWASEAGLERLGGSMDRQVDRYHLAQRMALIELDAMRLEWDERTYAGQRKTLDDSVRGGRYVETYDPAEIDGRYGTERTYGLMASWDEARKLVGGLQLLAAGVIDLTTLQENLSGIDNIPRIEKRRNRDQAGRILFEHMGAAAQAQDPRALAAMLHVHKTGDLDDAIDEFFMQEEEPVEPALPDEPPDLATALRLVSGGQGDGQVLSRLTGGGRVEGGAQTVQRTA